MKTIINLLLSPLRFILLILFCPIGIMMLLSNLENEADYIIENIMDLWILY